MNTADGQKIESWYIKPSKKGMPVIVLFHGNAGNFSHRIHKAVHFIRQGYGVLLAEYRGYGGNDGQPSEAGFYQDGRAQIEWLLNEKKFSANDLVLYGESIGSATAVEMATQYSVKALILETPFSSLYSVASKRYYFIPVKWLLKDRFMNSEKIHKVKMPLLILHGHRDLVIPFEEAKSLFSLANEPKEFIDFPEGNHNDLYLYGAAQQVLDFMARNIHLNTDNK